MLIGRRGGEGSTSGKHLPRRLEHRRSPSGLRTGLQIRLVMANRFASPLQGGSTIQPDASFGRGDSRLAGTAQSGPSDLMNHNETLSGRGRLASLEVRKHLNPRAAGRSAEAQLRCRWRSESDGIFEDGMQVGLLALKLPLATPQLPAQCHDRSIACSCETCAELLWPIPLAATRAAVAARPRMVVGVGSMGWLGQSPCGGLVCIEIACGEPSQSSRGRAGNTTYAARPIKCFPCSCLGRSGRRAWAGSRGSLSSVDHCRQLVALNGPVAASEGPVSPTALDAPRSRRWRAAARVDERVGVPI